MGKLTIGPVPGDEEAVSDFSCARAMLLVR